MLRRPPGEPGKEKATGKAAAFRYKTRSMTAIFRRWTPNHATLPIIASIGNIIKPLERTKLECHRHGLSSKQFPCIIKVDALADFAGNRRNEVVAGRLWPDV